MTYSRRDVLRMAGVGGAALWLGGCGSSNTAKPVAGDEWKQFGGTTLNFISENTAPTSAIAANLQPFTEMTGIEIKIVQLELAALVQKVALDFASGVGSYQIVYADPYQVLAPYHEALVDLNTMMKDPNLPKLDDVGDFIPTQLDAAGQVRRQGQALRAALRRADDDLAVPQGPVREVRRPHEAGPRLRPDAVGQLDLGGVLQDLQVVQGERAGRRPLRPRPPGQAARLADERLLERAVGLRRRLLQGRRQRRPGMSTIIAVALGTLAGYGLARSSFRGKDHVAFWIIDADGADRGRGAAAVRDLPRHEPARHDVGADRRLPDVQPAVRDLDHERVLRRACRRRSEEAAMVDGASRWTAFRRDRGAARRCPAIATTAILCLVFSWNDYAFAVDVLGTRTRRRCRSRRRSS